jgi:hypothetical protein
MMGRITEFVSKRSAPCELTSVAGPSLHLSTPLRIDPRAAVKVEEGNRLWMGEVCACTAEPDGYSIEVESDLMFRDVAATEYMAGHFRQPGKDASSGEFVGTGAGGERLPAAKPIGSHEF